MLEYFEPIKVPSVFKSTKSKSEQPPCPASFAVSIDAMVGDLGCNASVIMLFHKHLLNREVLLNWQVQIAAPFKWRLTKCQSQPGGSRVAERGTDRTPSQFSTAANFQSSSASVRSTSIFRLSKSQYQRAERLSFRKPLSSISKWIWRSLVKIAPVFFLATISAMFFRLHAILDSDKLAVRVPREGDRVFIGTFSPSVTKGARWTLLGS